MSGLHRGYSALDRALHRFALGRLGLQKVMADLEDDVYARKLRGIESARPVFITSLPRAGTTLLLDLITKLPHFASHSYRNMPWLLAPILWDSLSKPFRKSASLQERAHGDGMAVGYDSPEAFEEVLWKAFWPAKYHERHIDVWTASDRSTEFEDFFRQHLRKILFLKQGKEIAAARYVSKNNANIARLELLPLIFPDCRIVVPFRNPLDHVGSLLRQHKNFLGQHAEDAFAADYMALIGHFDFGANLKPIDFQGNSSVLQADPLGAEFWIRYWIAAFRFILARPRSNLVLLDYDALCRTPGPGLARDY